MVIKIEKKIWAYIKYYRIILMKSAMSVDKLNTSYAAHYVPDNVEIIWKLENMFKVQCHSNTGMWLAMQFNERKIQT